MYGSAAEWRKSANKHKGTGRRVLRARSGVLEVERSRVGMETVHPQVLFRGGGQPFRGNNREWYPGEASGMARGLRVLERMVIMERCILTMFITEGARHHNSLSALRALLSWSFSRHGRKTYRLYGAIRIHWSAISNRVGLRLRARKVTSVFLASQLKITIYFRETCMRENFTHLDFVAIFTKNYIRTWWVNNNFNIFVGNRSLLFEFFFIFSK